MHGGRFDDRTEGLAEVNAWALRESTEHQVCLVPIQGAIRHQLVLEKPLVGDKVRTFRTWNELPCVVPAQSNKLILHGETPMLIIKCGAVCPW